MLWEIAGRLHLLYELVGREAEPFVSWPCPAPGAPAERLPMYTDASAALAHMLTKQKWQEAKRCAVSSMGFQLFLWATQAWQTTCSRCRLEALIGAPQGP